MRPDTLAEAARRAASDGDWAHHLNEFLDCFYLADGETDRQGGMIAQAPPLLGDPQGDAFFGGAGEHLARRWGLPIPAWVRADSRYLARAMFYPDIPSVRGYLLAASPVSFRTRLIFTGSDPLQRARFPYHKGVIDLPLDYPARGEHP